MDTEVLIVGAGPTGLVLAIWLARLGIHVRVIDKAEAAGTTSRALAVQSRTLELYRQLELSQHLLDHGLILGGVNLWARGKRVAHANLEQLGEGESPYPFGLIFSQDEHERFLIERLEELGVKVERGVELTWLEDLGDRVIARLSNHSACEASFVAGCDGAHSKVRESLGIEFEGGTYQHLFYVADVDAAGPLIDKELHVSIDEADFAAIFPLHELGRVRLIGTIREDATHKGEKIGWSDISRSVLDRLRIDVTAVNWFSTYRVHHRVAPHFRKGNVFLLGDAAHIHSPVGGQGMNTGIGDSVNLGWKLAEVLRGRAPTKLLDSYEPERIGFARRLVSTTDRVFEFVTRSGRLARWVRLNVAPSVIQAGISSHLGGGFLFHSLSQLAIEYRHSAVSVGSAGRVHAGDRLPWVPHEQGDNFTVLESLDWQVHVYGAAGRPLEEACVQRGLTLHQFEYDEQADHVGLMRDAMYLVRPDGYVAFADAHQNRERFEHYLDSHGLRFISRDEAAQETWYSGV
ncbi:MAG: FAD-dependent oxidoreductase [Myxococcaceae bacterium]